MPEDSEFGAVLAETRSLSEKETLTPEEYQAIKRAVFGDVFQRIVHADTAYFLLGNYDGGERERRLEQVKAQLREREGAEAYLMKDVPEAWEFWPTKFRILADRATYIVPVLEDTAGSHAWELGVVSGPKYRPKVHVLKREYGDEDTEHERYDALPADFVRILDRDGRVYHWSVAAELEEAVTQLP